MPYLLSMNRLTRRPRARNTKHQGAMSQPIRIIYTPKYDIGFLGIERLHPFDARKFSRAWKLLKQRFGRRLNPLHLSPTEPLSDAQLRSVHSDAHMSKLQSSSDIAAALELPVLGRLPYLVLNKAVVRPMRWAGAGTVLAAEYAMKGQIAVNLGGGYHHASEHSSEGFCLFSDVGVAIVNLREKHLLREEDRIGLIDLDAHQGNGFERTLMHDKAVSILDMYNQDIYPQDEEARKGIDVDIPIPMNCNDTLYMEKLQQHLPAFLDQPQTPRFVFYNAGTDILDGDKIGGLKVSAAGVIKRDLYVFSELKKRDIPFVMLLSGGYSAQSFQLIADSVTELLKMHGIAVL